MSKQQQRQPQGPGGFRYPNDPPDVGIQALLASRHGHSAKSSQEPSNEGNLVMASTGRVCPLCGTITESDIDIFKQHLITAHWKLLFSCGYCCQVFDNGPHEWAEHVAYRICSNSDWLVVNQILGLFRYTLGYVTTHAREEIISCLRDTLPVPATDAELAAFNVLLHDMEVTYRQETTQLIRAIQLLKANQVCIHQIVDCDYVISPGSELCMLCGLQDGGVISTANQVSRDLCPLTTPAFTEPHASDTRSQIVYKPRQHVFCPVTGCAYASGEGFVEQENLDRHIRWRHHGYWNI